MSIKVTTRVWEYSDQSGSHLLAELAIADHCDDYGVAWPSIARVARKARVSERQAKRIVRALVEAGEMVVIEGRGRTNTNIYFVTVGLDNETIREIAAQHQQLKGVASVTFSKTEKVTSRVKKVTSRVKKGDIAMSPESSEPSLKSSDKNNDSLTAENSLPLGIDTHQRAIDKASGGNGVDPVGEVAKHLRWLCAGPGVPLPRTKKASKPYLDAGRKLLEDTDPNDWRGVCQAIDDWSEFPPEPDVWRRERTTEPHFSLTQISAHYWRLRNRPPEPAPEPSIIPDRPAPDPTEALWVRALSDLSAQMPRSVYHAHLANSQVKRDNGTLRVFVSKSSADWLNDRWLPAILAAVRGVDDTISAVEVGT
jgi:hypothetical protein